MWSTLVPVMVGGAIGAVSGWLGPWLLEGRKEAAEKKRKRAEKFEELVATAYEHQHWLNRASDILVFGNSGEIGLSPLTKIEAISATYFPQFKLKIEALDTTARAYELWTLDAGRRRLAGEVEGLTAGGTDVYRPYLVSLNSLLVDLREYAKTEFN
jgi:hypothetical protein